MVVSWAQRCRTAQTHERSSTGDSAAAERSQSLVSRMRSVL